MMQETHPLKSLVGHKGAVLCCCVHGESLVTAGHDRKIVVWDAAMGTIQREIIAHEHIINSLEISSCQNRQGVLILSASWDKTVKVWTLRNGQLVSTFLSHNNRVKCVKAIPHQTPSKSSPTSYLEASTEVEVSLAVSGDDDGHIYVWDIRSAQALLLFDEHARSVVALALYFDTTLNATCLVSASVDATIRLWDLSEITLSANHDKVTTQSSICAIKTPSKYISSLVTGTVSSLAPLITGTDTTISTNNTVNTTGTTTTDTTPSKTETLLLAADTLGSIYVYRALTGALLVRLETKCKIISLFTTHFPLNSPSFPNQQDMNSYYAGIKSSGASANEFVTPERNELLLQYATMKRQHNIVNTITHRSHATDAADSSIAKYVYYIPDNGSTGCFCLSPDTLVSTAGSTATNSGCIDVASSIALTHALSLSLCQSMDTLYSATSTRRSTSGGSVHDNSTVVPRKNLQLQMNSIHMSRSLDYQSQYNDDNCSVGSITAAQKKTPLAHSKTEPNAANVSTNHHMLKSCTVGALHSDYNDSVNVSGNVSLNNSGKLSASNSSKALQAFNSSATPNSSKTRRVSTRTAAGTNVSTITGKKHISNSSGGVMSVSINTTEPVDKILLQCFAMSALPTKPNLHNTNNATQYMIFGGRDSVLFYCAYKPNDNKNLPNVPGTNTFTPGAPLSLVIPRPAVLSMTDILTPSQSPNDAANNCSAGNTGSGKKSGVNSSNASPAYKSFSPQAVFTPKIGDHMHSSPYKSDASTRTSTSNRIASDNRAAVTTTDCAAQRTDSTSIASVDGAAATLMHNNNKLSTNTDPTYTTANPYNTTNYTYAEQPTQTSRTLPELVDESLVDLEDEMSLSEVSHIHHYYNDILSGRISQRPDDVIRTVAKNKTYLSAILREDSVEESEKDTTEKATGVLGEDYKGSMLEYLHGLDRQHSTNVVTLSPPIAPTAKIPYHPANHTNTTYNNDYTPYAITSISSNSKPTLLVSGYASIVKNSSMDSGFWEAANTAKSKYSFGRIKLQSQNNMGYGGSSDGSVSGGSVSNGSAYSRVRNMPRLHAIGSLDTISGAHAAGNIPTISIINTSTSFTPADNTLANRAAELKKSIASKNAEQNHRGYKTNTVKPSNTLKNAYNVPLYRK